MVADIAAKPVPGPVNGATFFEAQFPTDRIKHVAVVAGGEVVPPAALGIGDVQAEPAMFAPAPFAIVGQSLIGMPEQVAGDTLAIIVETGGNI